MLIGSEDISRLDGYSKGDLRVVELNGAFNMGNRGMANFMIWDWNEEGIDITGTHADL